MEMVFALLSLQFVSGLCINLIALEDYLRNNTLLEAARDRDTMGNIYQDLSVNNEKPTGPKRIFKLVPVKTNNKWNKRVLVQPDVRHLSGDVPVAVIVAANGELYNIKLNNNSQMRFMDNIMNITENKQQFQPNSDVTTPFPYTVPLYPRKNDFESNLISNLRLPNLGNLGLQNIIPSTEPHVENESKEEVTDRKDVKGDNKTGVENENEDSKETNIGTESVLEATRKEPSEKVDDGDKVDSNEDNSTTPVGGKRFCHQIKTSSPEVDTDAVELHFDAHRCVNDSRKLLHDFNTHERDFNVFFVLRN